MDMCGHFELQVLSSDPMWSGVVRCGPIWSDVVRCALMRSDAVISHTPHRANVVSRQTSTVTTNQTSHTQAQAPLLACQNNEIEIK